jgi:hypothetical protein
MTKTITHRRTRIVTLEAGDDLATACRPGDIAIREEGGGWGLYFVADDGSVEGYDQPYPTHQEAVWSAKAAAEYASTGE